MTDTSKMSGTQAWVHQYCEEWKEWGAQFGWKALGMDPEKATFIVDDSGLLVTMTLKARQDISNVIRNATIPKEQP